MSMITEIIKIDETPNLQQNGHISSSISKVLNSIKNWTFQIMVYFVIGTLTLTDS